jgi:ATP-dependent protease HslVU (ClpYQ) peptidase subunit
MTLCIAASCYGNHWPRIVVSSDWKAEVGDFASAEIQNKLYWLFKGRWCVLIAGTASSAHSLLTTFRQTIDPDKVTKRNLEDEIVKAVEKQREKLADHYVRTRHSVSFEHFRTHRAEFDEAQWSETSTNLRKISLDCQLIVCTFIKKKPFLFQIEEDGHVWKDDNFLAIGSGSTIANSILCVRRQNDDLSISDTVYNVFEATQYARKAKTPGVGKLHAFSVLYPGRRQKRLRRSGLRELQKLFKKYGPRDVPDLDLPSDLWEKY